MKILLAIILTLSACAAPPPLPGADQWIVCTYPVDGRMYRMNATRAQKTIVIPGENYATFHMPNGRDWQLTSREANNFCIEESAQ